MNVEASVWVVLAVNVFGVASVTWAGLYFAATMLACTASVVALDG